MGSKPKILVATAQRTVDVLMRPDARERLQKVTDVAWRQDLDHKAAPEAYAKALADVKPEIVMTGWQSPLLTAAMLQDNPQIKYVVNLTGELKRYVERGVLEKGVVVSNWADVPAASVAEASLMMTLASLRRAGFWQVQMHQEKKWSEAAQEDRRWVAQGLFDKTVGLYGFGAIARKLVGMLKPFDVRILVFSGYIDEKEKAAFGVETVSSLKELFQQSDVVSIHTGNRPDTFHTVNAEMLSVMKTGGHIVNTARGPIVDEMALADELKKGRLFAALDVYEKEPLQADSPLRGLVNCLLFPHQGGPTDDYRHRCGAHAVDQVERYVRGEAVLDPLTLSQYDRMT